MGREGVELQGLGVMGRELFEFLSAVCEWEVMSCEVSCSRKPHIQLYFLSSLTEPPCLLAAISLINS